MSADGTPPPGSDDGTEQAATGEPSQEVSGDDATRSDASPPPEATPATAPAPPTGPAPGGSNGMAIAALVLGIIALVFGFIPFLGAFIAIPLGIVAIVLGILGRGQAKRSGTGKGLATGGVITGTLGIVIAVLWGLVLAGLFFTEVERFGDIMEEFELEPFEIPGEPPPDG